MRRAEVWRAAVVMAVGGALLASACSSSKSGVTAARKDIAAAAPATTTTIADPYAVPPVIDVAYVNRVLAGLDAAVGDVVRFVVGTKPPPHEITLRLRPFYDDRSVILQLESFHQDAAKNYSGYRNPPGNEVSTLTELVLATRKCIFARVVRDYRFVVEKTNPDLADQWIAIVPNDPTRDLNRSNVTGWSYIYEGFEVDHAKPKNPCDGIS